MNPGIVYIVHCIDTEGPLNESIEATFERINSIFDFEFEVSEVTLRKLQNKEIDLGGKEEAVANLVAARRINTLGTWDQVDEMLDRITAKEFRMKHADSFGTGWIYNWFCLDHVGYTGDNPRRRDLGHHNIFDHYRSYNTRHHIESDLIQWHYHPLPIIRDAHRSGNTYLNSSNIFEILAKKIIDRKWFPTAFRPGFHCERPDSHWFLEQWIPFDYANQSVKKHHNDQPDMSEGRFGDWRSAPISWIPYHPDFYDYQKPGRCNRYIARCLNMEARLREITLDDVRDAFYEAGEKGKSLLSFTNHDFRDMYPEIEKISEMIKQVSSENPDIKYMHVNAIKGMREVLDIQETAHPCLELKITDIYGIPQLIVKAKNEIFGVQPFLAIKTKMNQYVWQNFDFQGENEWSYTFDYNNLSIDQIDRIGVATNTKGGVTEVVVLDVERNEIEREILNQY